MQAVASKINHRTIKLINLQSDMQFNRPRFIPGWRHREQLSGLFRANGSHCIINTEPTAVAELGFFTWVCEAIIFLYHIIIYDMKVHDDHDELQFVFLETISNSLVAF